MEQVVSNLEFSLLEKEQFNQVAFENLIKTNPDCNLFITPAKFKQFIDNYTTNRAENQLLFKNKYAETLKYQKRYFVQLG